MTHALACLVCREPLNAPALRHRGICLVVDEAHGAAMDRYDRTHRCEIHSAGGKRKR